VPLDKCFFEAANKQESRSDIDVLSEPVLRSPSSKKLGEINFTLPSIQKFVE